MFINTNSSFVYGNNNYLDKKSIYTSHPYTNWSLNPGFEYNNKREHTDEGFRKVLDYNSLKYQLNQFRDSKKIYCMGGSSTYCTELYSFEKTWPSKLQKEFNINKYLIINAGVGGWSTLQSLIRFIGWATIIKPEIIIIYQSKNDLTPFYNGRSNQKNILPLLENITLQFSEAMIENKKNLPKKLLKNKRYKDFIKYLLYKKFRNELGLVYSSEKSVNEEGLKRYNDEFLNSTVLRYEIITKIANDFQGKVLYIPEIINQKSVYFQYMQNIHNKTKDLIKKYNNFYFFDIENTIPMNEKYFLDNKMHFSEEGSIIFSKVLINQINKLI